MDLKICICLAALIAIANAQAACIQEATKDQRFLECSQTIASAVMENMAGAGTGSNTGAGTDGSSEMAAIFTVLCNGEVKEAMKCMLSYVKGCPELAQSGMGGGMNLTEIEIQGGLDVYCEIMSGDCQQMQTCMAPLSDPSNLPSAPSGEMTTIYSSAIAGLGMICGPVKEMVDCLENLKDTCPNSFKKFEEMSKQMMVSNPSMQNYDEATKFTQDHCPAYKSKEMCIKTELNKDSFATCMQEVMQSGDNDNNDKFSCKQYHTSKMCLKDALDETCGMEARKAMVAASPLMLRMPGDCDVGTASNIQASVITAMLATLITFLFL